MPADRKYMYRRDIRHPNCTMNYTSEKQPSSPTQSYGHDKQTPCKLNVWLQTKSTDKQPSPCVIGLQWPI